MQTAIHVNIYQTDLEDIMLFNLPYHLCLLFYHRVIEYVEHLREHFKCPVKMQQCNYLPPQVSDDLITMSASWFNTSTILGKSKYFIRFNPLFNHFLEVLVLVRTAVIVLCDIQKR